MGEGGVGDFDVVGFVLYGEGGVGYGLGVGEEVDGWGGGGGGGGWGGVFGGLVEGYGWYFWWVGWWCWWKWCCEMWDENGGDGMKVRLRYERCEER